MELSIRIKEGLGDIRYDMPVDDIYKLLGEASEVEHIENAADEPTIVLRYAELGITMFFEGDGATLQCIDISNPDTLLFGEKAFTLTDKEVAKLMVTNKYLEQDIENEGWGEKRVTFNDANIDFYFEKGKMVSIIMGK